ncbi:CoA transferase [Comamonas testosteroni]|uniref:CaiB/BaiF CoA transferase family protein n=1 Tax=Comamonas testosteroni TaxID=285 RepID=UPI0023AB4F01|nr:CoA transferase [Comamonas testosteroni]WEE78852.1 CoA transferase [Comamonas testosteroni]
MDKQQYRLATENATSQDHRGARTAGAGPLKGVRVLDLSTMVAAPWIGAFLADLGADVVKVESPARSDPIRDLAPLKEGISLWEKVVNRGKRSMLLDLQMPEGKHALNRILPGVDILIENFKPGTLDRWGLSEDRLLEANPSLIILRVTGFGQAGPLSQSPGFGRVFEAMTGFASLCGTAEGSPLHPGVAVADAIGALFGALGAVSALLAKRAGAPGQTVDLSLSDALLRIMDVMVAEYDQTGNVRSRTGNAPAHSAPGGIFATSDHKWVTVISNSPNQFAKLCAVLGHPKLPDDPRYNTNVARIDHRDDLDEILGGWCATKSLATISSEFERAGVAFAQVATIEDVFANPHFIARNSIAAAPDPDFGSIRMPDAVPRFQSTPNPPVKSSPVVGSHTGEVLKDWA